ILLLIIGVIYFPYLNWNTLLNISPNVIDSEILHNTIMILYIGVLIQFLFKIINSVFYAMQLSVVPNILALLSNILLLIYILYVNKSNLEGNLILLAKANMILNNLPIFIATVIVFKTKLKNCKPSFKYFRSKYAADVMSLGLTFFWLQLMSLVLTSTNDLLITLFSGPQDVVEYQIYFKLFSLVGTVFTLSMIPVWSAITKAKYENNFVWIKKIYNTIKLFALIFVVFEFALIIVLNPIMKFWLNENSIQVNYSIALVFATFGGLYIWHSAITSVVNGIGKLKIQIIFLTLGGLLNIPVAYILFSISQNWLSIVVANIISILPYCIVQPIWLSKYLKMKELEVNNNV
ncbi:MAG: lipopolysaccharide biosynthesis protein, partial [Erysipelotrichaceae bacterium]